MHTFIPPRLAGGELGVVPLTIGQPVMVQAMVRVMQPGPLELVTAEVGGVGCGVVGCSAELAALLC